MPFTLHFNSNENTELLDISVLEELSKCTSTINSATKFDTIIFDSDFNQPIPKLPTCIKRVEFGHYFKQNISGIGEHIETITFYVAEFNYNLSTFPKGLRDLKIASDKITSRIENINSGLENLTIQCETFNGELNLANTNITSIKIVSNAFNHSMPCLPLGLKTLEIHCDKFNSLVDNLPPGLESLYISSFIFNQPIDNLSSRLKTLILENLDLFNQPINNLPHGLEHFILHLRHNYDVMYVNTYKHTLMNLPNSIRKMVLDNYWGDLNTISDNVVELEVMFPPNKSIKVCTHIQHWNKLPSSLKKLDVNKNMTRINSMHNMIDIIKINLNLNGICVNDAQM